MENYIEHDITRKIDVSIIEALTKALERSEQQLVQTLRTEQENFSLFKMNFIKKFLDDVMFLNDLSGRNDFYHRYGYLILRNMLEQLIEFLYVRKNEHLVDEYLGLKINLDAFNEKLTPVEGERRFGQKRYTNNRQSVADMARDIKEYKETVGIMTLYDVYSILSEQCHNSYFDSLLRDFNAVGTGRPNIGLAEEQLVLLNVMVAYVLIEY